MEFNISKILTSAPKKPESSILIIYTGGTLGMVRSGTGTLTPFDFSGIMSHIPSLKNLELKLTVLSFAEPIDSSNIDPEHWQFIGRIIYEHYDDYDGFVVLHGTDTMAYTASAISFMLQNLSKPVVFTGAQLPITSFRSDARENLISSLEIASARQNGLPIVPEVCIYFDSKLLRANRAKKVESVHFDAFESDNYPLLGEAGVIIGYNFKFIAKKTEKQLTLHDKLDRNVSILKLYPGITEASVDAVLNINGLRGLVLETFGAGNAPTHEWFMKKLNDAIKKGVVIINVSQCSGGTVNQGRYETSENLEAVGIISGADITLEAAITKLMIILGEESKMPKIRSKLTKSISGEITKN